MIDCNFEDRQRVRRSGALLYGGVDGVGGIAVGDVVVARTKRRVYDGWRVASWRGKEDVCSLLFLIFWCAPLFEIEIGLHPDGWY